MDEAYTETPCDDVSTPCAGSELGIIGTKRDAHKGVSTAIPMKETPCDDVSTREVEVALRAIGGRRTEGRLY